MAVEGHMNVNPPEVATFKSMRIAVGVLAIAFPLIMIASSLFFPGPKRLLNSISAYYNSPMRDIYVGNLCIIAFFLFCYKGYDTHDNWCCNIAGILAFIMAFIPTTSNRNLEEKIWISFLDPVVSEWIHTISAAAFFCILAYISIFLFTHTHKGTEIIGTKKNKNIVFIANGSIIMIALIFLLIINTTDVFSLKGTPITLTLQTIMLISFGSSWLVKGIF